MSSTPSGCCPHSDTREQRCHVLFPLVEVWVCSGSFSSISELAGSNCLWLSQHLLASSLAAPATESLQEQPIHSSHDMLFYTRFDLLCFSRGYSSSLACTHTTTSFLQVWKMQPTLGSKAGCKGRLSCQRDHNYSRRLQGEVLDCVNCCSWKGPYVEE